MNRHPSRQLSRYESVNNNSKPAVSSMTSRSLFASPITEAPVLEELGRVRDWDVPQRVESMASAVSESMWNEIQNGSPIADLIRASPAEVITALRDHSVKRLGSFEEADVLLAFGERQMLTRGSDTARDSYFAENWKEVIKAEARKAYPHQRKCLESNRRHLFHSGLTDVPWLGGWDQDVTLTAYVVHIKDAAAARRDGLLSPLISKSLSGAADDDIWDFPAVRAIIEYKWRYWARFYTHIEFGLYLGWVISFAVYMVAYIECDLNKSMSDQKEPGSLVQLGAHLSDLCALLFMIPFVIIDYNSVRYYGKEWIAWPKLFRVISYLLQVIVTVGHLTGSLLGHSVYKPLLAVHCVILFARVQYFTKIFSGTSFVELLAIVVLRVRWFFAFILITIVSVSLAFAVLYKEDEGQMVAEGTDQDFGNTLRSLVTTYSVLVGDFDSDHVFQTDNKFMKAIFFVLFQVLMSITMLNLLIAVMTESYTFVMANGRIIYNIGRARAMEQLEVALPARWGPTLKPYCHFIVVEKKRRLESNLSAELSDPTSSMTQRDVLQTEILQLKQTVEEIKTTLHAVLKKLE